MTVYDLISELSQYPHDAEVVLSLDPEGNGCSPAECVEGCRYKAETTWSGNIDQPDEPFPERVSVQAVCLWPRGRGESNDGD